MEYYYTPKEYISSSSLTIVDDEVKHLKRVLRKNTGDEIFVTDGLGNLYKTKISSVNKEIIECDILESSSNVNEPKIKLTLYQSL
ncbi:MAG: RsmE family RNA methyltransferase, partial [Chlorobi bacterium]|nr:RsmE family RNA methyltransferase [Chlorobiota bacterium]